MLYKNCVIFLSKEIIQAHGGDVAANNFKCRAKTFFGVSNLDGMPEPEQIKRINQFWRQLLEPVPNTTFIRTWLEDSNNLNEYILLFNNNWCKDVITSGALR